MFHYQWLREGVVADDAEKNRYTSIKEADVKVATRDKTPLKSLREPELGRVKNLARHRTK
jgi:hypothetical protein